MTQFFSIFVFGNGKQSFPSVATEAKPHSVSKHLKITVYIRQMFWKKKNKQIGFKCSECGKIHSDWPALAFKSPANYHYLSETEKVEIGKLDSDFCEIHYDNQIDRFIRVTLFQKIYDACENLQYGLWVSLSDKSYDDYKKNYNNENHVTKYFGWLCSNIHEYGNTLSIPCDVITKTGNDRPEIFPHQDFDHPFVKDYYSGISKKEAEKRIEMMLKNVC